MTRILVSLTVLLGCFAYAAANEWIRVPQAVTIALGMLAYTALTAETRSNA